MDFSSCGPRASYYIGEENLGEENLGHHPESSIGMSGLHMERNQRSPKGHEGGVGGGSCSHPVLFFSSKTEMNAFINRFFSTVSNGGGICALSLCVLPEGVNTCCLYMRASHLLPLCSSPTILYSNRRKLLVLLADRRRLKSIYFSALRYSHPPAIGRKWPSNFAAKSPTTRTRRTGHRLHPSRTSGRSKIVHGVSMAAKASGSHRRIGEVSATVVTTNHLPKSPTRKV